MANGLFDQVYLTPTILNDVVDIVYVHAPDKLYCFIGAPLVGQFYS